MTFETNIYKIYETMDSQIYRFLSSPTPKLHEQPKTNVVVVDFECPKCKTHFKIQANLDKSTPLKKSNLLFPVDNNIFKCPVCGTNSNLTPIRLQIEATSGKKIVK